MPKKIVAAQERGKTHKRCFGKQNPKCGLERPIHVHLTQPAGKPARQRERPLGHIIEYIEGVRKIVRKIVRNNVRKIIRNNVCKKQDCRKTFFGNLKKKSYRLSQNVPFI